MGDFNFSIIKQISVLSTTEKWNKELNIIKWGDDLPKFDLRKWDNDHKRMSKGIALTKEELLKISECIKNNFSLVHDSLSGKKIGGDSYNCEIIYECEIITNYNKSTLEVNIVKWNSGEPCFDIRRWFDNKEKIGKGICLNIKESKTLIDSIEKECLIDNKPTKDKPINTGELEGLLFI